MDKDSCDVVSRTGGVVAGVGVCVWRLEWVGSRKDLEIYKFSSSTNKIYEKKKKHPNSTI
jgi:hypothetical protein